MKFFLRLARSPLAYLALCCLVGVLKMFLSPTTHLVLDAALYFAVLVLAIAHTVCNVLSGDAISTSEYGYVASKPELAEFALTDQRQVTVLSTIVACLPHVLNGLAAAFCFIFADEQQGGHVVLAVVLVTTAYQLFRAYSVWLAGKECR